MTMAIPKESRDGSKGSSIYIKDDGAELLDRVYAESGVGNKSTFVERLIRAYAQMPEGAQMFLVGTLRPSMRGEAVRQLYDWFMRQMEEVHPAPARPGEVGGGISPPELGRDIQSGLENHPAPEPKHQAHTESHLRRKGKTAG